VAEHQRLLDDEGADPAVLVVMHVGAAHTDRAHRNEDVSFSQVWERADLEPNVAGTVQRGHKVGGHCGWICTLNASPEPASSRASGKRSIGKRSESRGFTSTAPLRSSASASWNVYRSENDP
jgi:hypothetical protein